MILMILLLGKLRILKSVHFYYICHTKICVFQQYR